ncbi:hypothetical protein [Catenulispora pinisilvae]|uniref:hypothetical protein n=1 Tax=Catenulispora pinisilvae TaxID=2705253 RepID=UPI001891889B|nr:hypothetical protein [Catenulispora pinisilvae]
MASQIGSSTLPPFSVSASGVTSGLTQLQSMTGGSHSTLGEVEGLVLDVMSFAGIGSAVGSANNSLHTQLVGSLGKIVSFVETLTGAISTVLKDYESLDQKTADSYKALAQTGGQTGQATAASGTQHPAATATPAATPVAHATAAAGTNGLPNGFVTNLMHSEGASGNQGGVPEVYGFRQSSHNGYDQIMAARNQYGQGSPQEQAVVAQLLSQHADQAGAQDFTDPGIRAAIASSAHMRGTGGTRAILNSMATGNTPDNSDTAVSAANMATLQQMTPDQFQQSFHDARINYDQSVYGNTTTHVNGQAMTWWQAYGHGLTTRYNREQTQFDGYSQAAQGGGQ